MTPFRLMTGFETATVDDGRHDLTVSTGHFPSGSMRRHYQIVRDHGLTLVRDGLPFWLPIRPRMQIAQDAGIQVVWALDHWWLNPDPEFYARKVVRAVKDICPTAPFRFCFVELSLEFMNRRSFGESVAAAKTITEIIRAGIKDARLWTSEPANRPSEIEAHAPWAEEAEVIGLNIFPHEAQWSVYTALMAAWERYRKPLAIAETSFNPHRAERWADIRSKADWLRHCLVAVHDARLDGAEIVALSWHPAIDSPPWHNAAGEPWPHGLIRLDGTVDAGLSEAIQEETGRRLIKREGKECL